jgi:DMSO reductase anchor subunit
MKLQVLFIITAVIAIVFGLAFVIMPAQVYSLYGIESTAGINYMAQLFGAALIGFGLIALLARNADDSVARKAIILAFFIANGIGFLIALIGQLNEIVGSLGWLTVAIYFLLSFGFGYYQFSKPSSSEA